MDRSLPRLVLLGSGGPYARVVARRLNQLGISFQVVTIANPPPKRRKAGKQNVVQHLKKSSISWLKGIHILRQIAQLGDEPWVQRPIYAGFCNSPRCLRTLRRLAPDYIVMGTGSLLSHETIATASKGVLNAHPGLLPWIRGVDVVPSAILRDLPIGITVHYIDAGIDTGPILTRYLVPVEGNDSLAVLRARAESLSVAAIVNAVSRMAAGEELRGQVQKERFPYCARLDKRARRVAAERISDGRALALYREWKGRFPDIRDGAELL